MTDPNTIVYVVTHKKVGLKLPSCYKKIAVGPLCLQSDLNDYAVDNIGDNISAKNTNYCELTAHYWIWKNSIADIVGLCHYRRFLTKKLLSNSIEHILTEKDILNILGRYDIILPYRPCARRTVKQICCGSVFEKDWDILRNVIAEKEPEYLGEFDALAKRHSNYPCNVLICKKELFDKYSDWLFEILFEVEKRVDISGYDKQKARIFGYMSERLLEVWVRKNNLKIKHYRLLNTERKRTLKVKALEMLSAILNPFKY